MSFNVTFYSFSKKYNSTAQPTTGGTTYACTVKDGTSIYNPKIELNLGMSADPSTFNYAYIPNFERYYFIKEWNFANGLWIAYMEVDVLATYKTQIGASNLYVLRAAGDYDGRIIDNKYPTKTGCNFVATSLTSPYNQTGCFVIGVVSPRGYFGSVTYFVIDRANMNTLLTNLMTVVGSNPTTPNNGFSLNDASLELQLSLINPIQYIKSCVWLPVAANNITTDLTVNSIKVFDWLVNCSADRLSNPQIILRGLNGIALSDHPQKTARGAYMNCAPYTIVNLLVPPFGVVPLDTTVTCDASTVDADIYIDAMSGNGSLEIKSNGIVLNKIDAQVGVPIQLTQVTRDYVGAITSIAQGAAGVASGIEHAATATSGAGKAAGVLGAVGSGVAAIGNAVQSVMARVNSVGSNGSFSQLTGRNPEIDFQFFETVDDDISHNGRPLCKNKQINTLSGYMLIQDGDVSISGSQTERERIKDYLETGFYYE